MPRGITFWARAAALLLLGLSAPAHSGAVLTVNLLGEPAFAQGCPMFCTLRDAINQSVSGDTIRFAANIDGQTILLTEYTDALSGTEFGPSAFFITGNTALTVDGITGMSLGVTIARDASADKFRLFDVDSGSSLTLAGVTLANGFARGFDGIGSGGASLGAGGAIFNAGTLAIERCTLRNNVALGGAFSSSTSVVLGGAGVGQSGPGVPQGQGGGPNGGASGVNYPGLPGGFGGGGAGGVSNSLSSGGSGGHGGFGGAGGAGGYSGGFSATPGAPGGNGGFGAGGGEGGTGNGIYSSVHAASGIDGYGAYHSIGGSMGGAIFNDAGTVTIKNSTLTGNAAQSAGASAFGGAIFNYNGSLTLDFVTMAGNAVDSSKGNGVAIYSLGDSLSSCQSGANPCTAGGHILTMNNSIAANKMFFVDIYDVVVTAINAAQSASFGSGNLIMTNDGFAGGIATASDPQLEPLANNGGTTQTLLPALASAAVDAIACNATTDDQRGVTRPQLTGCDIGAVERKLFENEIFENGFDLDIVP